MINKLYANILRVMVYLLILIYYILLLLLSPIWWIKYRLLPYKKRQVEIELMVVYIDIPQTPQNIFELLLGNKKIYRTGEKGGKIPATFYISKKDFSKLAEHINFKSKKTVKATLEVSYWKYGFGKSRLVSHKVLDRMPLIRK